MSYQNNVIRLSASTRFLYFRRCLIYMYILPLVTDLTIVIVEISVLFAYKWLSLVTRTNESVKNIQYNRHIFDPEQRNDDGKTNMRVECMFVANVLKNYS